VVGVAVLRQQAVSLGWTRNDRYEAIRQDSNTSAGFRLAPVLVRYMPDTYPLSKNARSHSCGVGSRGLGAAGRCCSAGCSVHLHGDSVSAPPCHALSCTASI
jgi:hypothetical protein